MKFIATSTAVIALLISTSAYAALYTLYDGSLNGGTQTPDEQGYLSLYANQTYGGADYHTATGGVTTFSTDSNIYRGFGYQMDSVTLDRTQGYMLSISMRIDSEDHSSSPLDQAGFSICLSSSDSQGIYLNFWEDEIWVYTAFNISNPVTKAEGFTFDTTAAMTDYDIYISGTSYELYINGSLVLGEYDDDLRDPVFSSSMFGTPSTISIGDLAPFASSTVEISNITLNTVPEPLTIVLLGSSVVAFLRKRMK